MGLRYRAIYRDGKLLAKYEGGELTYLASDYTPPKRSDLAFPYVMRDIGEYQSPIDSTMITSRSQHREHMREHNVIEVGNEKIGHMQKPEVPTVNRELGEFVKRRIDEVAAMPQSQYDAHVETQQAGLAEAAALVASDIG